MTTVYGVTMYGATQQIKRQLKALEIESDQVIRFGLIFYFFVGILFVFISLFIVFEHHLRGCFV